MFDWPRLRRFLGNLLRIVIPFLAMALTLAVVTEILTQEGTLPALLGSVRFWLSAGLDMLPMILAMVLVLWFASRFLQSVYHMDSWMQGMAFLLRSRCGLRQFRPSLRILQGETDEGGDDVLRKIGGPGHLVVHHDSAVVLERSGRLSRVVGAGLTPLERFEKVYDVIDLRPKTCNHTVSAMTREGIRVSWDVELRYQIDNGGIAPTYQVPYPLSERRVLRAATCKWVYKVGGTGLFTWERRLIIAEMERHLRVILSRLQLDQLIGLTGQSQRSVREAIQTELETELRREARRMAARILSVRLYNLAVDDAVTKQWIKFWRTKWENWSSSRLAHAEATYVHQYEIAKAEAQMQMITQITEALERQISSQSIPVRNLPQIVLMRLFSTLDRADFASSSRVFFPTETVQALESIQHALISDQSPPIATIVLTANPTAVPFGGQSALEATLTAAPGNPVPDDTLVHFATTLGSVVPTSALTASGRASSMLVAGNQPGAAIVTARIGSISGTTSVQIG
jgi:regulator of protease activity HflC (stomatin/prohibitin superfamily)